jgi:hypothetical protein
MYVRLTVSGCVCSFTSDELRYLPINTALYDPPKKMKTTLAKPAPDSDETGEVRTHLLIG